MRGNVSSTRATLINAARLELIDGDGQLEMQAVARRAQLSTGLAYYHFGSKAGLIAAVVEDFYARLDALAFTRAALPSSTWAEREKARIAAYVRFHYDDPLAAIVIGTLSRSPDLRDVEAAFTGKQLVAGARMIEAAQRAGIIAIPVDPHLVIHLMIGGIRQGLIGALGRAERPDAEQLTDDIWRFMSAALQLRADGGPLSDLQIMPA